VAERSNGEQDENILRSFPKQERVVPGPGPGVPQFPQLQAQLLERFYRARFVFFHVEDGVELRDLEQVVYFLGEVEQL
jgi:hypothetical protein